MQDIRTYVCRAADEFRAADQAASPEAAKAHRLLAEEFVHLIRCNGNLIAYRASRDRREYASRATAPAPLASMVDA
jgi:hypothetical protein